MSFTTVRRSNHPFAREPNSRSSALTVPAMMTEVPERELDEPDDAAPQKSSDVTARSKAIASVAPA